jgi:tetratricopeptide (TPR) repeat protein
LIRRAALAALAGTLALALAVGLSGCAVFTLPPQTAALARQTPAGLPARAELTGVPFFPQTPYHCGPAALATVLAQAGLVADVQALGDAVFLPAREGSLQLEMVAGARRQGAVATQLPGELPALLREVAAGHPVVVLQNLGLSFAPRWHYAVLVGYDLDSAELLLRSGTTARERLSFRTFEHTWARSGHWAITALAPGQWPATASQAQAQAAAIGFERAAPPAQAALAYRSLLARWPGNLVAGIGLGNALQAAGDLAGAAQAFTAMGEYHDSAVAWNNLARLQLDRGEARLALAAAEKAASRAARAEPQWQDATAQTLALARAAVATLR